MKQLTRRIRQLEERAGYNNQVVYFIESKDLTESEIDKEIQRIKENNPNAIIFIDDIAVKDSDNFEY